MFMEQPRVITTNWRELSPLLADCLQEHMDVIIPITGTSMLPLLRAGRDRVMLTAANADALKAGDIPLYRRRNGQFVLHRVVAVEPDGYTMLGDSQTTCEPGIQPDQILAVVKGVYHGERYRPVTHWCYRMYVRVWAALRPVRGPLLRVYHLARRVVRHLQKSAG